jgi:hypothetical protein
VTRVLWLAELQFEVTSPEVSLDLLAHFEGPRDRAKPCFAVRVARATTSAHSSAAGLSGARVERRGPRLHYTARNTHATFDLHQALGVLLPEHGGLLLHAAAIERRDGAGATSGHVFLGASGAGKSTLAALSASAGARVLGDEIVAVRVVDGRAYAYGTPLGSRHGSPGAQGTAPLTSLCWLRHGPTHAFRLGRAGDALSQLLARTVTSPETIDGETLLRAAESVLSRATVGELTFALDAGFLAVLPPARPAASR